MNRSFLSITSLTLTHLKQVVNNIDSIKEEELLKLDQIINTYLLKRR